MLPASTLLQGRYLILEAIGQGGMGAVYKATDTRLRSTVALKETLVVGEVAEKAFEREAQLLAGLRHAVLPKVSDHFTDERGQFLVMEFIPGDDLATLLERQKAPFAVGDVLCWADQLLDGLEYLHSRQPPVIHRDIKPQNLKLTERGEIILLDFGLAKGAVGQTRLATAASVFGFTPHYAPLEQIQGVGTDPRSDLYSLAATLYHLLTNQIPPDALSRAAARIGDDPDPLLPPNELNPEVSEAVSAVLMQAMAQKADLRPPSAAAMRLALQDALSGVVRAGGSSGRETVVVGAGNVVQVAAGGRPSTRPPARVATAPRLRAVELAGRTVLAPPEARRPPAWILGAGAVAIALLIGLGAFFGMRGGQPSARSTEPAGAAVVSVETATLPTTSAPAEPSPTIDFLVVAAATQTAQAQREADMIATALLLLDSTASAATQTAVALIPTNTPIPPTSTLPPTETAGPTNTTGPTNTLAPTNTRGPTNTPAPTRTPSPTSATTATPTAEPVTPTPTAPTGAVLSAGNGAFFRASVDIGSEAAGGQGGTCIEGRVAAADGGKFGRFGVQVDHRGNTRQANTDFGGGTYRICGLGAGEWGVSVFNAGGVDIPGGEQVAHQVRILASGTPGEVFYISFKALPAFAPPTPTPTPLVGPYDGQWQGRISGTTAGEAAFNGTFRMEVRANAIYRISIDGPSCLFETYPNFPNGLPISGSSFALSGSPFNPVSGGDGSITFSVSGNFASPSQASGLLNASQNGGSCAVATWNASK